MQEHPVNTPPTNPLAGLNRAARRRVLSILRRYTRRNLTPCFNDDGSILPPPAPVSPFKSRTPRSR